MTTDATLDNLAQRKIIIATPFYNVQGFSPYIESLVASVKLLDSLGIENQYWSISGDSYIDRARNSFVTKFYYDTDYTDIIFIDSDESWKSDEFLRFISHDVEVLGAAYPLKNNWHEWGIQINVDEQSRPIVDERGLLDASVIPGGFMRISRKAIDKIVEAKPELKCVEVSSSLGERELLNLFERRVINGVKFGEDVSFCISAMECGCKINLEPRMTISHFGVEAHTGNYHEYLLGRPGGSQSTEPLPDLPELLPNTMTERAKRLYHKFINLVSNVFSK